MILHVFKRACVQIIITCITTDSHQIPRCHQGSETINASDTPSYLKEHKSRQIIGREPGFKEPNIPVARAHILTQTLCLMQPVARLHKEKPHSV